MFYFNFRVSNFLLLNNISDKVFFPRDLRRFLTQFVKSKEINYKHYILSSSSSY